MDHGGTHAARRIDGPVAWGVIGSELSLREHVARQAGVKRVTVHEARGRLISGIDIVARAWLMIE